MCLWVYVRGKCVSEMSYIVSGGTSNVKRSLLTRLLI